MKTTIKEAKEKTLSDLCNTGISDCRNARKSLEGLEDTLESLGMDKYVQLIEKTVQHLNTIQSKLKSKKRGKVNEADIQIPTNADDKTIETAIDVASQATKDNEDTDIKITNESITTSGKTLRETLDLYKKNTPKIKTKAKVLKEAIAKYKSSNKNKISLNDLDDIIKTL